MAQESAKSRQRESSRCWNVSSAPGAQFFKAVFHHHSYVRHTHETYAIGVIESGVQTFYYRGAQRITPPHGVIAVNPDEVHDGRSFDPNGYHYRMIYVEPDFYRKLVCELSPRIRGLPSFPQPVLRDEPLANLFLNMHRSADRELQAGNCPMEQQSRLLQFLALLARRYAEDRPQPKHPSSDNRRVRRAIEYMREGLGRKLTLDDVAGEVGLSRYYFLRMFRSATGLPPHAYLCQLRLEAARELMLAGCSMARAALRSGFFDQSHFTNRFRKTFGVAPGQYLRGRRS